VRFAGFDRAAPGFFHELAAEQSRDWFHARKDQYLALWQQPMQALLDEIRSALVPVYKGMTLAPAKIFRIQRDVRFAADKSPYKTHIAGVLSVGARKSQPQEGAVAMYVSLGLEEYSGAGHYIFEGDQLARWRRLVGADKTGKEIAALIAKTKLEVDAHEILQRVPKPFENDHPRAALLRHKGLIVGFPDIPAGMIHKPAFAGWLVKQAKAAAPVVRWLAKHVA